MQWAVNLFTLFMTIFIVIGGKYSDQFSKKRIFLIGVSIFLIGACTSGIASNFPVLLLGRILQGVGAGISFLMAMNVVFSVFQKKQKEFALGILFALIGLGQGLGPIIGGAIIKVSTWHWIFLGILPLARIFHKTLKSSFGRNFHEERQLSEQNPSKRRQNSNFGHSAPRPPLFSIVPGQHSLNQLREDQALKSGIVPICQTKNAHCYKQ